MSGVSLAVGVGTSLLSGDDGGGGAGSQAPQFNPILTPFIEELLPQVTGTTRDVFQGPRVADFNIDQTRAFDQVNPTAAAIGGAQGNVLNAFNQFASGANIGANPFLDAAIDATRANTLRDVNRGGLNLRNTAVGAGGIGGSRQGIAEGLALGDALTGLSQQELDARRAQFNQDTSNQLAALTGQGQILSGQTSPIDLLLRSGGLQQQQEQAGIDAARAQFGEEQDLQFNRDFQVLQALLGTSQNAAPEEIQNDPFSTFLGGVGTAQGLGFNKFDPFGVL